MRNLMKYMVVLTFTLSLFSCVKDKGNYDFTDISDIDITNLSIKINDIGIEYDKEQLIILEIYDNFKVVNNADMPLNVKYKWTLFDSNAEADEDNYYPEPLIIGTEKNLNYNFSSSPSDGYSVVCEIANVDNNSKFYIILQVEIESIVGLCILHASATGDGDYSAIRTSEMFPDHHESKLGVSRNLYSTINDGVKLKNPKNIFFRTNTRSTTSVMIGIEENMIQLDFNTLEIISTTYKPLFYFAPDVTFDFQLLNNGLNNKEQVIIGGKIHGTDYMSGGGPYGTPFSEYGSDYAPYIISMNTPKRQHVVFNMTKRKFQIVSQFNGMGEFTFASGDVNVLDTKMDLLYMDMGNGDVFDAVMKDDSGDQYYVRFSPDEDSKVTCVYKYPLSSFASISNNNKWAISSRGNIAYYANNNEVYLFNIEQGSDPTALNLGLSASSDIVCVSILKDMENTTYDNAVLLVAVNDGEKGKLLQYTFNPLNGSIDLDSKKEIDGFEKIIDMRLKK